MARNGLHRNELLLARISDHRGAHWSWRANAMGFSSRTLALISMAKVVARAQLTARAPDLHARAGKRLTRVRARFHDICPSEGCLIREFQRHSCRCSCCDRARSCNMRPNGTATVLRARLPFARAPARPSVANKRFQLKARGIVSDQSLGSMEVASCELRVTSRKSKLEATRAIGAVGSKR